MEGYQKNNIVDEESESISQPKKLNIQLFPHQLSIIHRMHEIETKRQFIINDDNIINTLVDTNHNIRRCMDRYKHNIVFNTDLCILNDKVGAGKTLTVIGLICHSLTLPARDIMVETDEFFELKLSNIQYYKTNLIIVSHNIINQWKNAIEKSNLRYIVISTNKDLEILAIKKNNTRKKMSIYDYDIDENHIYNILEETDVVILNINRYSMFKQFVGNVPWNRVIIDEFLNIKMPLSFFETGIFTWLISGSPWPYSNGNFKITTSIKMHYGKVLKTKKIYNFFCLKNDDEFIGQSIELPTPNVFFIYSRLDKNVSQLWEFLPNDVMNMINAGNYDEAVTKLNCGVYTENSIIDVLDQNNTEKLNNLKEKLKLCRDKEKIILIKKKIESYQDKIDLIKKRVESIKQDSCIICMDTFKKPVIVQCCKSVYCMSCLFQSLKATGNKCPYCRGTIDTHKKYYVIDNNMTQTPTKHVSEYKQKTKIEILNEVLKHIAPSNPKILLFSEYSKTFSKLSEVFKENELSYSRITGTPGAISNKLKRFNHGDLNILLIDSHHYGSGLNLQKAEYIIIFHRMSEATEIQIIGRAQRIGRTKPLNIIYIINEKESDETVYVNKLHIHNENDLKKI
jgi:SNF2 family DNA or RNA helicase